MLQADPSWGGMGPQQGPVGYQGRRRSNGIQPGPKQHAVEADAALAVLQEQFPLYNQDSLTDVLKVALLVIAHFVPPICYHPHGVIIDSNDD